MVNKVDCEKTVSLIIPAYNEAETIGGVVKDFLGKYPDFEVLVIDDGSTDDTATIAKEHGAKAIRREMNRGYGASLKEGVRKASGDIVLLMDADGQHSCDDIKRLLDEMAENDMVVGKRNKKAIKAIRKPGKWILMKVADLLVNQKIPDINSGFRAIDRNLALKYLPILPNGFSFTTTITLAMIKDARNVKYIPIEVSVRQGGKSYVSYFKDGVKTLLLIFRVIMLFNPLKIFVPISAAVFGIGVIYTLYTLVSSTDITDISIILLLSGLGMFMFGLLADQIANIRRGD
jgi:glycosyltransferase involved in cell wall biosynthesis